MYKRTIGKQNESTKVADINSNFCTFFKKNSRRDPFTSFFINMIRKYGRILSCPIKPVSVSKDLI